MLTSRPARAGPSYSPYPSRSSQNQTPTRNTSSAQAYRANNHGPPRGYAPQPARPTLHHPPYPPGPLPYFLPPPGQPTTDPTFRTPPRTQAMLTTYPSRLRTGVTGLIQPENITGGPREREIFLAELDRELFSKDRSGSAASTPRDSPAPFGRRAVAVSSGGRRGRVVNYAEKGSDDEDEQDESDSSLSDLEEPASDPDDGTFGDKRKRGDRDRRRDTMLDPQTALRHGRLRKKKEEMDKGWTWLGDRVPGDKVRSQVVRPTRHQYIPVEEMEKNAQKAELLVPITIDFDVPSPNPEQAGIKIKDRFLWNANETQITPLQFACIFCDDAGIRTDLYAKIISDLIEGQVEEAQQVVEVDVADKEVTPEDVVWSDDEVEGVVGGMTNGHMEGQHDIGDDHADVRGMGKKVWAEADCRIIVNLDVQIYTHILRDRIEWDLSSPLPPTLFAKQYCAELGLTGEAIPLIAHAITEELLKHKKDCLDLELFATSHPDQQARWERSGPQLPRVTSRHGAPGLKGIWRDWTEREEFGPVLVELSMEEMERREQERLRESRRLMRGLTGNKRRR